MNEETLTPSIVFDEAGNAVPLRKLLANRKTRVVLLRDFISAASRLAAQEEWASRHTYRRAGKDLVFIAEGTTESIAEFRRRTGMHEAVILAA